MKKLICAFFDIFFSTACSQPSPELLPGKIYFFYSDGCPHCHEALEFIDREYPDLQLTMVNVSNPGGYQQLVLCARKFKLGSQIGTPLFCTDDNYLMGWSDSSVSRFRELVRTYQK